MNCYVADALFSMQVLALCVFCVIVSLVTFCIPFDYGVFCDSTQLTLASLRQKKNHTKLKNKQQEWKTIHGNDGVSISGPRP
jgi:hypothetical protein